MNSQPVSCDEIKSITRKEVSALLQKIKSRDAFLISKNGFNLVTKDKIQSSVFLDCHSVFEKLIKPIVINSAMEAEALSPGAGELSFIFCLELLKNHIKKDLFCDDGFLDDIENMSNSISHPLHANDINKIISNITDSDYIKKIINLAIPLAGSENKIFVEPGVSEETSIELLKGYFFKREVSQESQCFFDNNRKWEKKNSKVFIVDGDIVSVSDIHFLLESLSDEKRPCILIARSFAPDVLNTLHVNFARGTLNVIPVDFPFEQDTANILVDIAAACNTDIVTPLKGDLISKSCRNSLDSVKRVKVDASGITIENPGSDGRCHALLLNLKNRIQSEPHIEIREILSRRIASLSGSKVLVKIGKKLTRDNPYAVEDTDKILRCVSSTTKNGVILNRDIIKELRSRKNRSNTVELFLDSLSVFHNKKVMPSHSVFIAAKKGLSTFNIIKNTSHGLLVDNN